MKHTKGPWNVGEKQKSYLSDEGAIYSVYGPRGIVCNTDESWADESLANARLIAAAPEMLEALKKLSEAVRRLRNGERGGTAFGGVSSADDLALAAIAKATGDGYE